MNDKIKRFIEENTNKHLCQCGVCEGEYIIIKEHHYYKGIPKIIRGHNMKSKEAREKQALKTSKEWVDGLHDLEDGRKRDEVKRFIEENTNKHICQCGCNEYIIIQKHHRQYGIPKYIVGHYSRLNPPFKGRNHTEESKEKNSISHRRENLSEETIQRMRDSHLGNKQTPETIEKIREASTGRLHTDEAKQLMRETATGRQHTEASNQKNRDAHLGKENTEESKEKNKQQMLKIRQNQRWNNQVNNFINGNSITDWIERPSRHYGISKDDYDIWRHEVYERDNHTCRICGLDHCLVHAHHIIPQRIDQDLILDINNGITMCRTCHELTYHKEELYTEELQMIVNGTI